MILRRLGRWSPIKIYGAVVAALVVLFQLFPGLDLAVSGLFYTAENGFALDHTSVFQIVHDELRWVIITVLVMVTAVFIRNLRRGTATLNLRGRGFAFVVLSLAVAPGLIANVVLKDQWGRARPSQIEQFGGKGVFTPAMVVSDQCDHNCSFVAGDPALGFWFLCFAFLLRRRSLLAAAGALSFGTALGVMRIAQGGHFFSDVLFSALFTGGTVWLLYRLIVEPEGPAEIAATLRLWAQDLKRWTLRNWRRGRIGRLRLSAIACGVMVIAGVLLIDVRVGAWARTVDPEVRAIFQLITQLGDSFGYLVGSVVAWAGLRILAARSSDQARRARLISWSFLPLFLFLAVAVSGISNDLVKALLGRVRPKMYFGDAGLYGFTFFKAASAYTSFPSGHSCTAFAVATAASLLWRPAALVCYPIAVLVAVSRVVIGAHWPSDVVGGAFIGVVSALYIHHVFVLNGASLSQACAGTARWNRQEPWYEALQLHRLIRAVRRGWSRFTASPSS